MEALEIIKYDNYDNNFSTLIEVHPHPQKSCRGWLQWGYEYLNQQDMEEGHAIGIGEMRDGLKHGEWSYYYEEGQWGSSYSSRLWQKGEYGRGMRQGEWTIYEKSFTWERGQVRQRVSYKDGVRQDEWKNQETPPHHWTGERVGYTHIKMYHVTPTGGLEKVNFNGAYREWKDGSYRVMMDNKLYITFRVFNGVLHGELRKRYDWGDEVTYYDEGMEVPYPVKERKKKINLYHNSRVHGEWRFYHDNGKLEKVCHYDQGFPTGTWRYYFQNGELKEVCTYFKGNKEGFVEYYHPNGKVRCRGQFESDRATGFWIWWDENGTQTSQGYLDKRGRLHNQPV